MNRDPTNFECTRDPIFILQKKSGRCWIPELVFLTREEGEDYARRHEHNYPKGWQVYCIPCDGELAKLLKAVPETADGKPIYLGRTVYSPDDEKGVWESTVITIHGVNPENRHEIFTIDTDDEQGENTFFYADRNNCPVGTDFQ